MFLADGLIGFISMAGRLVFGAGGAVAGSCLFPVGQVFHPGGQIPGRAGLAGDA